MMTDASVQTDTVPKKDVGTQTDNGDGMPLMYDSTISKNMVNKYVVWNTYR